MTSKTFKAKIVREGSMSYIPLTFDPKEVFGKVRAKHAEIRTRRIQKAVQQIRAMPARKR